jgi:hypothetical protein
MGLIKKKLVENFIEAFDTINSPSNNSRETAEKIEKAFLNYMQDVELKSYLAGINPVTTPPTPDPSYSLTNFFKPVISFESSIDIKNGLIKSLEANLQKKEPEWIDANLGFSNFLKTFISYETNDQYKAIGMTIPGNIDLSQVFKKEKYYISVEEVSNKLADHLHEFVINSEFQGNYAKIVGAVTFINPESLIGQIYKSNLF